MEALYSVRMRAALGGPHEAGGRHLSGGERLVAEEEIEAAVLELLRRAGRDAFPDFLRITLERVAPADVQRIPCLPVTTVLAPDASAAWEVARRLLEREGVSPSAQALALPGLLSGLGPGGSLLPGAAIMDAVTGARLEPDPARGVRASHLDYSPEGREAAAEALREAGLSHFRTFEALAVASKVIWAGIRAEVCWSDDPDYLAGYVATASSGYVRFPQFKPPGAAGGRVFFFPGCRTDLPSIRQRLERCPVLIEPPVAVRAAVSAGSFLTELSSN
jgi:6-carboxyhexanoate--CoA ligase